MSTRVPNIVSFLLGLIAGVIVAIILLAALWANEKPEAPELVLAFDGGILDMNSLKLTDWSEVCFVAPYTPHSEASDIVGAPVFETITSRAFADEAHILAAFKHLNGAIAYYDIPRANVDFTKVAGSCYPRLQARFTVPATGGNYARRA